MPDPRIASIDIETYGKLEGLPPQTCFSPRRSVLVDHVPPSDVVLSCSMTLPEGDPRPSSSTPWDARLLGELRPGETMVFDLRDRTDTLKLVRWLTHLDTLLGMNIAFDIAYLRAHHPLLRDALDGRHTLIDLSVCNYLDSEVRPERSLKTLGPILSTHAYDAVDLGRLSSWDDLADYNAQDTHNTLVAIAHLCRRLLPPKLSPFSLSFYSETIWSCVAMSEAGLPFSRSSLLRLFASLSSTISIAERLGRSMLGYDIILSGKGSNTSKRTLLQRMIHAINPPSSSTSTPSVLDHPLLRFTEEQGLLSWSEHNRDLLASQVPPSHPTLARISRLVSIHSHAQKLLGSYLYPLLLYRKQKREGHRPRSSLIVPQSDTHTRAPTAPGSTSTTIVRHDPDVWLSHPSWFIVPTRVKDDIGLGGGTLQGRITAKNGAHQTDPPEIQDCRRSRFRGGILVDADADQLELRVAALLSGDASLIAAYTSDPPLDLHTDRAVRIFTAPVLIETHPALSSLPFHQWKSVSSFKEAERDTGKHVNFGDLFRAGADTLQLTIYRLSRRYVPLEILQTVVHRRAIDRPGLWAWQEAMIEQSRSSGGIILPFIGQSRTFLGGTKYEINEIVNFPIQTTAGNAVLRLQHFLRQRLRHRPDILLVLNTYDSLTFDCATPASVADLRILIRDAVSWLTTEDYWATLQTHLGRRVPFLMTIKEITHVPSH